MFCKSQLFLMQLEMCYPLLPLDFFLIPPFIHVFVQLWHGGDVSSVLVRDPPPPPPCPPGPLSYQGSIATGHTYGGAKGARNFFFSFPLPILSTLHLNTILETNLDSNAHPNPQPTPNPTHKPYP